MKKHIAAILVILGLGVFSYAQGSKDLFDLKKSQTELDIMKGILSTTISYVAQNSQKDAYRFNVSSVGAYYLVGQGAVFVIPTSGLRPLNLTGFSNQAINLQMSEQMGNQTVQLMVLESDIKRLEAVIAREAAVISREAYRGVGKGTGSGIGSGAGKGIGGAAAPSPAPPAPPAPPAASVPPAPPALPALPSPFQVDRNELRKKVEEYQAKIKKSREEDDANREKFLESLKDIRMYLVEALANYGDSLTTVKPSEYINLILYTDSFDNDFGRMKTRHDIISAQKSWITDYKAGRLTLDGFKQKVLQYTE